MQGPRTRTVAAAVAAALLFVGADNATPANLAFRAMALGGLLFAGLA